MGDHRVSIKINFEMHGLKKKYDAWLNWSDCIPEDISSMIEKWKDDAMDKFYAEDEKYRAKQEKLKLMQVENEERALLEKLKEKYK